MSRVNGITSPLLTSSIRDSAASRSICRGAASSTRLIALTRMRTSSEKPNGVPPATSIRTLVSNKNVVETSGSCTIEDCVESAMHAEYEELMAKTSKIGIWSAYSICITSCFCLQPRDGNSTYSSVDGAVPALLAFRNRGGRAGVAARTYLDMGIGTQISPRTSITSPNLSI